ncbi:MAG: carbohydrate kinase [Bacteroidales bacterium]|nr:carbohydrate kinase [Bacteroidales bacterium]
MKEQLVIGMGEALWDVLPSGKKIGGAPANFAYHVSQFGIDSVAVSALGNDELGAELLSEYAKVGLNVSMERLSCPTGTVQVTIDEKGIPSYDICQGVAWDNIAFNDELKALAQKATVVCFGSLAQRNKTSRDTINAFIDLMPDDDGHLKVFDINLRQAWYSKEVIEESLRKCNILKINDEELVTVRDLLSIEAEGQKAVCKALIDRYALRMVILTCGAEGSYVLAADGTESWMDTPKVDVVDTVGAGDSFTGAFVAALLAGKSLREAHELAVKVSAFVCTQAGAMPVLPDEFKVL